MRNVKKNSLLTFNESIPKKPGCRCSRVDILFFKQLQVVEGLHDLFHFGC